MSLSTRVRGMLWKGATTRVSSWAGHESPGEDCRRPHQTVGVKWRFPVWLCPRQRHNRCNLCCQVAAREVSANKTRSMAFIDLDKAFDWVPPKVIWWVLRKLGVEETIVRLVQGMYASVQNCVRVGEGYSTRRLVFTKAWYSARCSSSLSLKPCHASSTLGSSERTSVLMTLLSSRLKECVRRLCTAWHWGSGPHSEGDLGSTGMDMENTPMVQLRQPLTYRLIESLGLGGPRWHGSSWQRGIAENGSSRLSTLMIDIPGDHMWDLPCMQQASYLEGGPLMWMLPLYLHVNQTSDNDDNDEDQTCRVKVWLGKLVMLNNWPHWVRAVKHKKPMLHQEGRYQRLWPDHADASCIYYMVQYNCRPYLDLPMLHPI